MSRCMDIFFYSENISSVYLHISFLSVVQIQISPVDNHTLKSWGIIKDENVDSLTEKQFENLLVYPPFRVLNDQTHNLRTSVQNVKAIQMAFYIINNWNVSYVFVINHYLPEYFVIA